MIHIAVNRLNCIVDTSGIHLHFVVTIPHIVDHELYNAYPF